MSEIEVRFAVYPERKCRLMVMGDHDIEHPCEVRENHLGPCATPASRRAVAVRLAWMKDNPEKVSGTTMADPYA